MTLEMFFNENQCDSREKMKLLEHLAALRNVPVSNLFQIGDYNRSYKKSENISPNAVCVTTTPLEPHEQVARQAEAAKRGVRRAIAHMRDLINVQNSHSEYLKYAIEDIQRVAEIKELK